MSSETGQAPTEFWSSLESRVGCEVVSTVSENLELGCLFGLEFEGETQPCSLRWLSLLELTGNVPSAWMCSRDLTMSGMESASTQSQSRSPCFIVNLHLVSQLFVVLLAQG